MTLENDIWIACEATILSTQCTSLQRVAKFVFQWQVILLVFSLPASSLEHLLQPRLSEVMEPMSSMFLENQVRGGATWSTDGNAMVSGTSHFSSFLRERCKQLNGGMMSFERGAFVDDSSEHR